MKTISIRHTPASVQKLPGVEVSTRQLLAEEMFRPKPENTHLSTRPVQRPFNHMAHLAFTAELEKMQSEISKSKLPRIVTATPGDSMNLQRLNVK